MSEYAKNIQTIEDLRKKRIELREEGFGRMSGEICKVVRLDGVEVQENGIIRDSRGWIIGHADTEWMRYQWRMLDAGICPCCGRKVVDA